MKLNKILFLLLFVFLILFVGGFLSKKPSISHPDIRVDSLKSGDTISSPFMITGEAKGYWYFEADFPIFLLDKNGNQIAVTIARTQGDWMTEDFVPFEAEIKFDVPQEMEGVLVFERDNASGLPEHNDEFRVPVIINDE